MSIYKGINPSSVNVYEVETHKLFELSSSANGITSFQYRSSSKESDNITFTEVGSYWNSLLVNFYLSGSHRDYTMREVGKYYGSDLGLQDTVNPQHKNKFHSSGSVLFIPQYYFGEKIQRETFTLTDNSHPSGAITIKDDGYGNLYAHSLSSGQLLSQSSATSISSSKNYVGNIFYNKGVVTITETGSYNGVWDLGSAAAEKTSPSMNAQDNLPYGFFWKPDGTKYWMIGSAGTSEIFEYNLSGSAWDVGSAAYSGNSFALNYLNARDISFREDGIKMYSLSGHSDKIYEHNLSTAWDITTITSTSQSFDISSTDDAPYGFYFKNDGLKVYMTGRTNDKVYEMNMSTAWDISSITSTSQSYAHSGSLSANENEIGGITFYSDGTRMYTTGDKQNAVYEHRLSTAWDITTATFYTSQSILAEENRITSVQWKPDGSKMYIMGFNADMIDQYNIPSSSFYTDILTDSYTLDFKSTHTIFTTEYEIIVKPNEYRTTSNPTIRKRIDGLPTYTHLHASHLTSSNWSPYMNTIGFYQENEQSTELPVMVARYSQPIKMRDDMTLIFKVRMDW